VHQVTLADFHLGKCEVTVAQFRAFVDATGYKTSAEKADKVGAWLLGRDGFAWESDANWKNPHFEQTEGCPVTCISWMDAIHYCNWLSRQEGLPVAYDAGTGDLLDERGEATSDVTRVRGYRLPTEAEWEYAARERGKKVRFGNGQSVARASEMNFDAASGEGAHAEKGEFRKRTVPVASFKPNALGLYDMSGNVWEWCSDFLGAYADKPQTNPYQTEGTQERRAARGGPWGGDASWQSVFVRIGWQAEERCNNIGFRIARTN
jgi:formylglycine-generating enzyme required for sulfatase activity